MTRLFRKRINKYLIPEIFDCLYLLCYRYPPEISQLDLSQSVWRHQGPHQAPPPDMARSRSRDRSRVDLEHRRRAQSKSPARRQQTAGVSTPDISGLSRMFRDLSGAVRAKMSKKGEQKMCSTSDLPHAAHLKSNLKKQRNIGSDLTTESPVSVPDNKKVHFNKFATVQMMA